MLYAPTGVILVTMFSSCIRFANVPLYCWKKWKTRSIFAKFIRHFKTVNELFLI